MLVSRTPAFPQVVPSNLQSGMRSPTRGRMDQSVREDRPARPDRGGDPATCPVSPLSAHATWYFPNMTRFFHVTAAANRDSILRHGLDWTRMGAAPGIAGSPVPESPAVYVCRGKSEVEFFLHIGAERDPLDVWEIAGVDEAEIRESDTGFAYLAATVSPDRLTLHEAGVTHPEWTDGPAGGGAYRSWVTYTVLDGTESDAGQS